MADNREVLIKVRDLRKIYRIGPNKVRALDGISFDVYRGEFLAIIGASGSGKSTCLNMLAGLEHPSSGEIRILGKRIDRMDEHRLVAFRRQHVGFIFQSYNLIPSMNAEENVAMPLVFRGVPHEERTAAARKYMKLIGILDQAEHMPGQMSGGQQQRVGIARALAVEPEFIVCDEPISALDVSIQSQVVNMLEDLQQQKGLTYLFIAHDISVVRHISNRIGVMYLGQLVELAESYELCSHPIHPYTESLLSAVPIPDPDVTRARQRILLEGDIPSPLDPPAGCRFHTRCPYATERCRLEAPQLKEHGSGHFAACHRLDG